MKKRASIICWVFIALCLALVLLPLAFVALSSLLSGWELRFLIGEVGSFVEGDFLPIRIPPYDPSFAQFGTVLLERPEILLTMLNSMGYVVAVLLGMLLTAPLAAFVFAKLRFRGRQLFFFIYVFLMLLPFQVMCVPLYLTIGGLGLMNTPWALILPEVFSPLPVFLIRQFMRSIPDSLLEAASVDGAGLVRTYLSIVLPLSTPALVVCGMICTAKCWNLIEQPLLFLSSMSQYPLALYISEMMNAGQPEFMATCVLAAIPILLLFLLLNDELMGGVMQMEL